MSAHQSRSLSWGERFALIDHYGPTDAQICAAFNVTPDELDTARELRSGGTFRPSTRIDVKAYAGLFSTVNLTATRTDLPCVSVHTRAPSPTAAAEYAVQERQLKVPAATHHKPASKPNTGSRPAHSASPPPPKEPGRRGRKGNNIAVAFEHIPYDPVLVTEFSSQYNVSLAVLRQSRRFDPKPSLGTVCVRTNKETGLLMVWRERPNTTSN